MWGRDIEDCWIAAAAIVVYDRVYYQTCDTGIARLTAARLTDGAVAWTRDGEVSVRGDAVGTIAKHLYVDKRRGQPGHRRHPVHPVRGDPGPVERGREGLSVGNGYVAAVVEPRIVDIYSLPGR